MNEYISQYNVEWPKLYELEKNIIVNALRNNLISIHHIGSTALPGMIAKPKIDIIAEVECGKTSINALSEIGYVYKGEWNIPFKYGFTKRKTIKVNLHVFEKGHPEIELNLAFKNYMLQNAAACEEYSKLKQSLVQSERAHEIQTSIFNDYNLKKDTFIRKIIDLTGFKKLRFLHCTHYAEWNEYHRIKQNEIFSRIPNIVYDLNHPHITDKNHYHFVLCEGVKVVGIGHVENLENSEWGLRGLAISKEDQNKGLGKYLLSMLEQWCKLH